MIGIYKITSPTGRIYIGQSIDINKRLNKYRSTGCLTQPKLQRSFDKYGIKNHIFEVVEECVLDLLNIRERYYQDLYSVLTLGLNCLLTNSGKVKGVVSEQTKNKIRKANIGKKASNNTRLKMSISKKGKGFTRQHKINLSISQKGIKKKLGHKVGKGNLGKPAKNRILVLETSYGIFYESVTEASLLTGISKPKLISYLKNRIQNKTNLIYC
jgi:group I intron endonuclease